MPFPPACCYELDWDNARCRTFSGCAAIAWRRLPMPPDGEPELWRVDPTRAWADWLMAAGGEATAAVCTEITIGIRHRWRGVSRLRKDVRTIQEQHQRAFAAMLRELTKSGELSAADAAHCRHDFHLVIIDDRGDDSRPLPAPAALLLPVPRTN